MYTYKYTHTYTYVCIFMYVYVCVCVFESVCACVCECVTYVTESEAMLCIKHILSSANVILLRKTVLCALAIAN